MADDRRIDSILAIDCGAVMTKAMLLDRVGGGYRLLASGEAPTTLGSSTAGIIDGVRHAVKPISHTTGRRFFDDLGDLIFSNGSGQRGANPQWPSAGAFTATVSGSEPLQTVLSGLVADLSIASARRAAGGTYSQIKTVLDGRYGVSMSDEERVRAIRAARWGG